MRVLKPEFVSNRPTPRWIWVVLMMLLVGVAAEQSWRGWKVKNRVSALRQESAALSARIDQLSKAQDEIKARSQIEPPYAKDALDLAKMARFALPNVLSSLEAAQVEGVRISTVEISAADGAVKVDLEFSTHEALLRFLHEISAGEQQHRWSLIKAQSSTAAGLGLASIISYWKPED